MDKGIIEQIAQSKLIEQTTQNIAKMRLEDDPSLKDLCQDLYLSLLTKDPKKIEEIWNKGDMKFFVTRMVLNQLRSKNSPYFYLFKKNRPDDDTDLRQIPAT